MMQGVRQAFQAFRPRMPLVCLLGVMSLSSVLLGGAPVPPPKGDATQAQPPPGLEQLFAQANRVLARRKQLGELARAIIGDSESSLELRKGASDDLAKLRYQAAIPTLLGPPDAPNRFREHEWTYKVMRAVRTAGLSAVLDAYLDYCCRENADPRIDLNITLIALNPFAKQAVRGVLLERIDDLCVREQCEWFVYIAGYVP